MARGVGVDGPAVAIHLHPAQVVVVRLRVRCPGTGRRRTESHLQLAGDRLGKLLLHAEYIARVFLEGILPEHAPITGVAQLGGDAHAIAGAAKAAEQNSTDAERVTELRCGERRTLESRGGGAAGEAQAGNAREHRREFVGDAFGEIRVRRVTANRGEGDDGE